ncbi:S66 peptidase family protein [Haladaptatus caseinilyticus]|uniref:S66 peptidase family protein n=1 Tax=Haladaptatus caseinilyticus TaxID=2993314 RepID=UPI00224B2788|nr:S66 peptidase family protein [Haladaptatus caseinilyticus]
MDKPSTYPPPLHPGSRVAVIATSHAPPREALSRGIDRLESFGLDVELFETATRDTDWLRSHPKERARDVNRAFADEAIDGVVAAMGGNREIQIVDTIDESILRDNPKRFYGSSDNTHLHLLLNRLGWVSFYGGQLFPDISVDPEMHPYTHRNIERAMTRTPFGECTAASEWTDEYYDFETQASREWFPSSGWYWHNTTGKTVHGTLLGGCFEMLESQLMMSEDVFPHVLDSGDILAIETSGETPTHAEVERFFTVLGERGTIGDLGGLLVGRPETPKGSLTKRNTYRREQRRSIKHVCDEYAEDLPIVFDLDFGHTAPILPLPLGSNVTVDTGERTILFE